MGVNRWWSSRLRVVAVLLVLILPLALYAEPAQAQSSLGSQVWAYLQNLFTTPGVQTLAGGGALRSIVFCLATGWCGYALAGGLVLVAAYRYYLSHYVQVMPTGAEIPWYNQGGKYFGVWRYANPMNDVKTDCPGTGQRLNGVTGYGITATDPKSFSTSGAFTEQAANECYASWHGSNPTVTPPAGSAGQSDANPWALANPGLVGPYAGADVATCTDGNCLGSKGITGVPPFPGVTPGVVSPPAPGTIGNVGNPPIPGAATDAPTQGSDQGIMGWLAGTIGNFFTWLGTTIAAQFEWLGNLLLAPLQAIRDGVQALIQAVTDLPSNIAEAVADLFVPTQVSTAAWESLIATVKTKPPFSLLPPATLFEVGPTGGPTTCALPSLSIEMPGMANLSAQTIDAHWPDFVCDLAGVFRAAMSALIVLSMAWWAFNKFVPTPTM